MSINFKFVKKILLKMQKMCCKFESYLYILNSFFQRRNAHNNGLSYKKFKSNNFEFFCGVYIIDLVNYRRVLRHFSGFCNNKSVNILGSIKHFS